MNKRNHKYPDFITEKKYFQENGKRYFLELEFDKNKSQSVVIILKNPSKATDEFSDHTVNRVSNYIFQNRQKYDVFSRVGKIIILNLTPIYETVSSKLKDLTDSIVEKRNLKIVDEYLKNNKLVIVAWGNHPRGFYQDYELLKNEIKESIRKYENNVFYVKSLSLNGNPKHGQGWGYKHKLIKYIAEKLVGNN